MGKLKEHEKIVGSSVIDKIKKEAEPLKGTSLLQVNSTKIGGGVAEILETMIPLFNELKIRTQWKVIKGDKPFFETTKNLHNAIQGKGHEVSERECKHYLAMNRRFVETENLNQDCVIIHDPQPCASITFAKKKQPWIWRCHIDLSRPKLKVWNFLKPFISMYDTMVVSNSSYKRKDIRVPQKIIMPSINPLNTKNAPMNETAMNRILKKYDIDPDKPIITQVSRFDKWKDPMGVIEVFKKIKKSVDCKLVLLGSAATDDPEGMEIYKKIIEHPSKDIIVISHEDDNLVNALQTISHVVIQKSIKEGFGLTVTEALWKGTPVIGGNVGGIKSQIIDGKNGYLVDTFDYNFCAKRAIKILSDEKLRDKMGKYGHEYVKKNFLTTRHLLDWIKTIRFVMK